MDFLINGLRLGEQGERRELLQKILEDAVPVTEQDVVIILVSGTGHVGGKLVQITEHHRIRHGMAPGRTWSAIQIATAYSACVVLDLFVSGKLGTESRGFVGQEQISYEDFMNSAWAFPYRQTAHLYDNQEPT
jgi:saccharopine dehydrogenase-like NADP-dependent oxidoreductase